MTKEHKDQWKCQSCVCKQPKSGNLGTPVRTSDRYDNTDQNTEVQNITLRRKHSTQAQKNNTIEQDSEDSIILGDTLPEQTISQITLQQLSSMISEKLSENNNAIITQLQTTIQIEIKKATTQFKNDFKQEIDILHTQNSQRKLEIENISKKIEKLEREAKKMQTEISEIVYISGTPKKHYKQEENMKKLVLYGIEEYQHESEHELHIRLIDMFREKLHIDLLGYIEDTQRIGKYRGKNRPLIIELLSKRMVKYILNQNNYLRKNKIAISPMLNENQKEERKAMFEEMRIARNKGLHAIIRDSQLYIQGRRINVKKIHDNQLTETLEPINKSYIKTPHNNQRNSFRPDQSPDANF